MLDKLDHEVPKFLDLLEGSAKVDIPGDCFGNGAGAAVVGDALCVEDSMRHLYDLAVGLLEDSGKQADLLHDI